ncbi:hypothetical protein CEE37_05130 [candidate division LCP-89 bacterium B3_LCP]|uniref:Uncharacterized protein n=1 Tax=candidate division LCP-89 bacterium B3_LCP TaxID=2012998 RepID=A0A532V1F8_UNCL8|nr:MAG: hypothetical protein CEE37_05130 [candidate division LCP-89 bacterium B3_LCP]
MPDTFYDRLDFYRMLNAGMNNFAKIAVALRVSVRTLERWKRSYDPEKGPYGSLGDISVDQMLESKLELLDGIDGQGFVADNSEPELKKGPRAEILYALRQAALEGNVPAAKLLLSEYSNLPPEDGEVLTVENAIELIKSWAEESK